MAETVLPAKPAATVLLLRDADIDDGIEVFMLRRTKAAAFAGGMYVFPGGKVDAADGGGDEGYVIAAIRECYEEAGVLLARDENGAMVTDGHPSLAHRQDVYDGSVDLRDLCTRHQLTPAVDDLVWISHWITPVGESPRRFDTRFFITVAPRDQASRHDDNETIASAWVGPRDAMRREERGELTMMPPTMKNLEFVAAHRSAGAAMESARRLGRPSPILPRMRRDANGKVRGISLPEDDDYATLSD
jgi:8-oxo-dGTP pyrophosphatase MutT (NUDIX family)